MDEIDDQFLKWIASEGEAKLQDNWEYRTKKMKELRDNLLRLVEALEIMKRKLKDRNEQ